jgi:endonuclease III
MQTKDLDKVIKILRKEVKKYTIPIVTLIAQNEGNPFQVLISTILSLRTKDKTTAEAAKRIFKLSKDPLTMSKLTTKQIEKTIYPVGFYITKAKRIKEICKILLNKYNGKVPNNMEKLLELPGVGRKTANLVLTEGFNAEGLCVDTHVHRISNRFGLIKTKNPEETEFALRKILPKKYWIEYNMLLVTYGQNICRPISPWCSKCPISKYCKRINVDKHR